MVTYAERPWLKHYDAGVPHSLEPYPDKVLHDYAREAAQNFPHKPALVTTSKVPGLGRQTATVTHRELDRLSDALAAGLIDVGLKKGDRVAIILPNVTAFAISYYGVLKAGGVVVATNPTYPPPKMQFQINDCDAEIVITLSLFYNVVKQIQPQTKVRTVIVTNIKEYFAPVAKFLFTLAMEKKRGHRIEKLHPGDHWFQDVLARYAGQKPDVKVMPDDLALFQYTGGTTGVSKGAMATHRALVANLLQSRAWTGGDAFKDIDRSELIYLGAIPLFHSYGLIVMLNQATATGARIVLIPNARDTDEVVDVIHHYRPNIFLGVPALFNAVNNHPRVKSGEVRLDCFIFCSSGAAPLPQATKREFEGLSGAVITEGFGMSEAPTASISNPISGENRPGSVGLPFPDMDMRIVSLDDGETEVPVGEIGELVMAGPQLMVGYHGMPTETANVLREKDGKMWLYTGDIARMDEDGYFYIVDRKKDMALIGGFNVYPSNIEKVLKEHSAVLEVGVAAIPHPERAGEETLKAWIVLQPGQSVTEQELIAHCSKFLGGYEVPRRFAFVPELPKSAVGKTLRRELIQMEMAEQEKAASAQAV